MRHLFMIIIVIIATACNQDPETINYGSDNCSFCKMTIVDQRFSCECVNNKGKTFKFDDIHCMVTFLKNGGVWSNELAKVYLSDFSNKGKWIDADKAFLLHSDDLKSPMGGNYAAFDSEKQRDEVIKQYTGEKLLWNQIFQSK